MMYSDSFSGYHPVVNFTYFAAVLLFTMVFLHPVCLGISLLCAVAYAISLNGRKSIRFFLCYLLPLLILTAILNPMFSHQGMTILCYLPNGNPITEESILYGIAAAIMLSAVIAWFSCYNTVMTSDKFVYLFGRIVPSLSLVFSVALRLLPRFKAQIKRISTAQKGIGRALSSGSFRQRIRHGLTILSIMITWALENSIDTADSMKNRGYGLKGRTAFSIYHFDRRDKLTLLLILSLSITIFISGICGNLRWQYYPFLSGTLTEPISIGTFLAYFVLCALPIIINLREVQTWHVLKSKI